MLVLFAASYCGLTGSGGWSTGKLSQKLVEVSCAILILEQRLPYHIHLCFSCRDTKPTRDEHMVTISLNHQLSHSQTLSCNTCVHCAEGLGMRLNTDCHH